MSNPNDFDMISIHIASPEEIKEWSKKTSCKDRPHVQWPCPKMDSCNCGEVKKPETINYRTLRSERDGLFCEMIFGPSKNWECGCGKYKRKKDEGRICDRCGVEVTQQKVRRERMGHINLAVPVSHIWFFKTLPSRIGLFLNLKLKELEQVLYFDAYLVLDLYDEAVCTQLDCGIEVGKVIPEKDYAEIKKKLSELTDDSIDKIFRVAMGAEAIHERLSRFDLEEEISRLRGELGETKSKQKSKRLSLRIKLVEGFLKSGNRPEWMILKTLPVIPPDLRPLVPLEGGRFATSDLNDLYRRVINRNNRLKRLMELRAPEVIVRNEKRMLQEAVDALLDNGRRGKAVRGQGNRDLKSLSHMLKGKSGRFRQNLLGKRVDYSGRSVIVVGPELELHQCGLPKEMAVELFKPFVIEKLREREANHSIKKAKSMTERIDPEVWEVLEEVIEEHPILLNRAPTLHRLGIQAFEPQLVEGRAIRLHPFVCKAFNADFDGDQMAVHVPLSVEAQSEARLLMLASRNILKPAHGRAIAVPDLDVVLGCSFLTKAHENGVAKDLKPRAYRAQDEVVAAHSCGFLELHENIELHFDRMKPIVTTVGRIIFNQFIPKELTFIDPETKQELPFLNQEAHSKELSSLVSRAFEELGNRRCVEFLSGLKQIGFHYATLSGISIGIRDLIVPGNKRELIKNAWQEIEKIDRDHQQGVMSVGERYNKVIDVWRGTIVQIETALFEELHEGNENEERGFNPIHIMADSGARSKRESLRQISGLRGLMAKPSGEIIERPIESCFREGLSVLEYFISTHGARKGLADTAIKTASSGYLTRKLVDVAQDVMVTYLDCGTPHGVKKDAGESDSGQIGERIVGRTLLEKISDPDTGKLIADTTTPVSKENAEIIQNTGFDHVMVRSPLTCEADHGICAKCYGADLTTGKLVNIGEAVGIIAAQSIGEPGTQLTMRTFHTGGTVSGGAESIVQATHSGLIKCHSDLKLMESETESGKKDRIVLSRNSHIYVVDEKTKRNLEHYELPVGCRLNITDGEKVNKGDTIFESDPYIPIISEYDGHAVFCELDEGKTFREDKSSGLSERIVTEYSEAIPAIELYSESDRNELLARYEMPTGAHLSIRDGAKVKRGEVIARLPHEASKSSDIVSGLPRVTELFEARKPKDNAFIATLNGYISFEGIKRGMRIMKIVHEESGNESPAYKIPIGKYMLYREGEEVKTGDRLTGGPINPHDILGAKGEEAVQDYLVNEVQTVYRSQGERINDKHIEVVVRQMLSKVRVVDSGGTDLLEGDELSRGQFNRINREAVAQKGKPAEAEPILQGITKAALSTESFISAASFQQTTNVLTKASIDGKHDLLRGLKENVIMGNLIPAGTGARDMKAIKVTPVTPVAPHFDGGETNLNP